MNTNANNGPYTKDKDLMGAALVFNLNDPDLQFSKRRSNAPHLYSPNVDKKALYIPTA